MGELQWNSGNAGAYQTASNRMLNVEGYTYSEFKKWKVFFSRKTPYIDKWEIPVSCKCRTDLTCYKHHLEALKVEYSSTGRFNADGIATLFGKARKEERKPYTKNPNVARWKR